LAQYNPQSCPICDFSVKTTDKIILCPDCKSTYHERCWRENSGCAIFDCKAKGTDLKNSSSGKTVTEDANKIAELEIQVSELVNQWLDMPASKMEKDEVDEFYWNKIFPIVCDLFNRKEAEKLAHKKINGLILTLGTSPQPLILSISACKPEKVLFLYTAQTEIYLDEIVGRAGLKPSQYDKHLVMETDPLDIYQKVLGTWEKWGRDKNIAVDITGGTKSMTGGLAMAGGLLGLQLLYVAGKFMPERRMPRPGTECLELLPNPYQVFGVLKEREAAELLRNKDFQGAKKIYQELVVNVPDPRKFEVLSSLARAYHSWDGLDFSTAALTLKEVGQLIKKYRLTESWLPKVRTLFLQAYCLEHLHSVMPSKPNDTAFPLLQDKEALETLIFTIYHGALRRAEQGLWDTASLLMYRLLEIMSQRRLAIYGLDTADPDYSGFKQKDLLSSFNAIRSNLGMITFGELPSPIGLMDGYILLEALEDPFSLMQTEQTGKRIHFRKFLNENQKRNHSILAHGYIFVTSKQYEQFKTMVDQLLELFCKVEEVKMSAALEKYAMVMPDINA